MVSRLAGKGYAMTIRITDTACRITMTAAVDNTDTVHRTALYRRIRLTNITARIATQVVARSTACNFTGTAFAFTGRRISGRITVGTRFTAVVIRIATL